MSFLRDRVMKINEKSLYFQMLRIRKVEEAIAQRYSGQEMRCPIHLSIGQEAVAVGVCASLMKEDCCISAHRSHAHYLAKGGSLNGMIAELYGKEDGCARGKGGSMHLFDLEAGQLAAVPIVGSSIPIGVGVAWYLKIKKIDRIAVVFLGDAATEEGVFSESLNFASLHSLPVLFVCENNFYSVYTPIEQRQSDKRNIVEIANAHGVMGRSERGKSVSDILRLTAETIKIMKEKHVPALLEFQTYRFLEHCGPNDDSFLGYRQEETLKKWVDNCPISALRLSLRAENKLTDKNEDEMSRQIDDEIDKAFKFAERSEFPKQAELFSQVYFGD